MALKFIMKSEDLSATSEDIKALYTEQTDGSFVLTGVEGISPKSKLDEFRTNNIELNNKLETLKDIDPTKYAEMSTEIGELKIRLENTDLDEDGINKIVEGRVEAMKNDWATKESAMEGTIKTQGRQLESLIIDSQVQSAALEHGISDSAMQDVILRAKSVFRMEEGKAIGYEGENKIYDDTGVELQSINGWVKGLEKTASHLFKASQNGDLNSGNNGNLGDPSKMTPTEKIRSAL